MKQRNRKKTEKSVKRKRTGRYISICLAVAMLSGTALWGLGVMESFAEDEPETRTETQEAIEKVLDALNDDPAVAKGMENDVEGTLRTLVGNEVSEQDFANLTKGTTRLFSDKAIAALFLKLLKNKKGIKR